jgi:hypothetical protein
MTAIWKSAELTLPAITCRSRFFSIAAIQQRAILQTGRSVGGANFFRLNFGCAAGAAIRAAGISLKYERQVYGSRLELHFGSTCLILGEMYGPDYRTTRRSYSA